MDFISRILGMCCVILNVVDASEAELQDSTSNYDPEMTQIFYGSKSRRILSAERSQDVSNPISSTDDSSNGAICADDHVQAYLRENVSAPSDHIAALEEQEMLMSEMQADDICADRQKIIRWIYSIYFASKAYRKSVKTIERCSCVIHSAELSPDAVSQKSNSSFESWSNTSTHVFFDMNFSIQGTYQTSFWQECDWKELLHWRGRVPKDLQDLDPDKVYKVSLKRCQNPLHKVKPVILGPAHARAVVNSEKHGRYKKPLCARCCCSLQ